MIFGKLMFNILGSINEFEVNLLLQKELVMLNNIKNC